jgi:hypothetical protein
VKTFVLGIHEKPERIARCLAHLKDRGIDGAEVVYGINAEVAGLNTSHPYLIDHPEENFHIGPKRTGVVLGHYLLWSVCAAYPDSHFLLFEDDVYLHDNFKERMIQAIRDTPPDFDMLYVGHCCCKGHPSTHIKGDVWDVRWPQCGHVTIVAKKVLPLVLATQRKCYGPQDITLILDTFPKGCKIYTQLPRSADQLGTEIPE